MSLVICIVLFRNGYKEKIQLDKVQFYYNSSMYFGKNQNKLIETVTNY